MNDFDIIVIGGGPAGAATAIQAARGGASVAIFEKAPIGRHKVAGDGITPRAIGALQELDIDLDGIHKITGLRMIAGKTRGNYSGQVEEVSPLTGLYGPVRN